MQTDLAELQSALLNTNNVEQFRDGKAQPIVWPPDAKTGTLIYPYEKARQK